MQEQHHPAESHQEHHPPDIQAGQIYWAAVDGVRMRVRAIRASEDHPGWWECETIRGNNSVVIPIADDWELDTRPQRTRS